MEQHIIVLKDRYKFTESMQKKIQEIENAFHTGDYFPNSMPAKLKKELFTLAHEYNEKINNKLVTWVDIELKRKNDFKGRNKWEKSAFLILLWASKLKPELDASTLFSVLGCREAYIELVRHAYEIKIINT